MVKRFKILLSTDYSQASLNAEKYAFQLAKYSNSELRIIHIYEPPLIPATLKTDEYFNSVEEFKNSELAKLEKHGSALLKSLNLIRDELNFESTVREGNVTDQIKDEASDWMADFIIAGTHGVTGFREVLFGTHTWNLIKDTRIPVLAIPKNAKFNKIKKIVFASEQRDGEIPGINFMVQVANEFKAQLTVLHVANHFLSREFEVEMFDNFVKVIKDKLSFENLNLKLIFHKNVIDGISEFCSIENTDWLVVSYEKPTLFEKIIMQNYSTTRNISFQTEIPMFCVPDYYNPETINYWNEFEQDTKQN